MKITITEALAELNTIAKRLSKKRDMVTNNLIRVEKIKDPFVKDGGSPAVLLRELQAINDLEARHINIRLAIQKANQENMITIGERTASIAWWLTWRKEIAPSQQNFIVGLVTKANQQRVQALRAGATVIQAGQEAKSDNDFVVNLPEADLHKEAEWYEEVLGTLDGQLSLKNATITIEI